MLKNVLVFSLIGIVRAAAQTPPPAQATAVSQQAGDSELGFFTGAVIAPENGEVKLGGGFNYAYAVNKYLYPYAEFSVMPGGLNSSSRSDTYTYVSSGNLADFHGGVHLRLPVNNRFVPYAVLALGGVRTFSANYDTFNAQGQLTNSRTLGSSTKFAFNYGGGIRYYLNNKVGLRFEVKGYGPTSSFGGTPVRIMGGIFFQFKRR